MKHKRLIMFFLLVLTVSFLKATTCTAIKNGEWNDSETWSCGRAPADNDIISIPAGLTVKVNVNTSTYVNMIVNVDGTLTFEDGKKLNLDGGGKVNGSASAQLTGGNAGSKININGATVWTGGGTTLGPFSYGIGPLPIELLNFIAKLNQKVVDLVWSTASEKNNDFFTIEKSTNGSTFEIVAKKDGAGNSTTRKDYTLTDENPIEGTSYYRLKQTDFDGKFEYSSLVAVNYEKNSTGCVLNVYPNPCTSECTIDLADCDNNDNPEINVELLDVSGSKVFTKVPLRDEKGSFSFSIDSKNNLKPGIYIVKGVSRKENYTKKIIVK